MDRVLLITSTFRWYAENYTNALDEIGCVYEHINASVTINKKNILAKIKNFCGLNIERDIEKEKKRINKIALEKFKQINANIVILTLGNQLYRETLVEMRKTAIIINIFGDTLAQYPYVESIADCFDFIYSYEMNDVQYLQSKNINCIPLMGLGNVKQYFPIKIKKDIDLCFVGAMYPNRKKILEQLYLDFPNLKMEFWGRYVGLKHPINYLKWFFSKKRTVFKNKVIHYSKVNELYNSSKICLNINGFQTHNGWSSRLVEIALTNSCQIVDYNNYINSVFSDKMCLYRNYDELKEIIIMLLNDDAKREALSELCYNFCKNNFTYIVSMNDILKSANVALINRKGNNEK